jgi:hypothetical protein
LAHLWTTFYHDYLDAVNLPRLIVRTEDTYFFPKQLMEIIADCVGMPLRNPFRYMVDKGKDNSATSWVTAMAKYGSPNGRIPSTLSLKECEYLQEALSPELMASLHYPPIPEEEMVDGRMVPTKGKQRQYS